MSNIDRFSIVTLTFFILSTIFLIHPISFHAQLPFAGRTRLTIGLKTAPMLSIAILWAAQCIGPTQIRDGIVGTDGIKPYNILILFISLAYMAITLDVTGILQAAAYWVSNKAGDNGRKLYFYFYVFLTLISVVLPGNDPIVLFGTTFLAYYTRAVGLEPLPWFISEFAAANIASMVLFIGNPANVVICEGFRINNAVFTAYTILPFIACSLACYGALAFQFRDPKHVPRKLGAAGKLNVRDALRDPVSAIFGSILLGICLIVVVVLSFKHVDVWKIVLPFAGVKFIFDLCWDHRRYTTNRIPHLEESKKRTEASLDAAVVSEIKRALSLPPDELERGQTSVTFAADDSQRHTGFVPPDSTHIRSSSPEEIIRSSQSFSMSASASAATVNRRLYQDRVHQSLAAHFPTFFTALPRLPFGLIPFTFSQFILIEGLSHHGWIDIFATWLVKATKGRMIPTTWVIGVLGILLCNVAGTSIGATILLTKVVRAANFPSNSTRAAAIALAVASNMGAVSFTFSASLAGILWKSILKQKGIPMKQRMFAFWNMLPLTVMTVVGLAIVSAEMTVIHK